MDRHVERRVEEDKWSRQEADARWLGIQSNMLPGDNKANFHTSLLFESSVINVTNCTNLSRLVELEL